ncbi:MAG: glycosyltransferase family 1 protein [bacterium]
MRICVDIQAAVSQRAGVGRYARTLVEHLGPLALPEDELRLFFFDFRRRGLDFTCPGAQLSPTRWIPGQYAQQAWKRFHWPPFDWFSGQADVFHFPNFTIPPLSHGKAVVTIHDMSFLRYPAFAEKRNLEYLTSVIHETARRADAIIAVSEFGKREIEECLGVAPDKVSAIHLGISPHCARQPLTAVNALRKQLHLARPYLLTVGTIEPRKNLPFMLEVFERLDEFDGDLVIAGMPGWKVEPIMDRMQQSPKRDRIRYLNYLPDGQLSSLYSGAELFLITSFYEGFGFTPLEAMACGTPVVSSAGGSLPEVLGDAAIIVPEFKSEAWATAIQSLLADTTRRDRLSLQGVNQASGYSWQDTARKTWDVYRKAVA